MASVHPGINSYENGYLMGTNEVVSTDEDKNDDFEEGNQASKMYERSRIKALADEREIVQKKTFTKWINSHLVKVNCSIDELYMDLRDGKMLLKLLEILSGDQLPNPTRGRMRIHCLENLGKSLTYLTDQHVHLENLGPYDLVDGNSRLTLGLIWTIILRFQIQDIYVEPPTGEAIETRSAKDSLLLWCQIKTAGYPNCNVRNFTTSWKDGLAFCALINKHRPDLLDYNTLSKNKPAENLEKAFKVAESLGIPRLLDVEDVNTDSPDEKSLITYIVSYYHYFNKMKADNVNTRRIGKVLDYAVENEKKRAEYEAIASDLLEWIQATVNVLNDREFSNSLQGVQSQLAAFNTYRTVEKTPKFTEKGNLEVLLFTIQSSLRAHKQRDYQPSEGKYVSEVNKAWETLERAEHARELVLREELIRQEKSEQLSERFEKKAGMRENWLAENQVLLAQDIFGTDLAAVEAATKKHEAIETDIFAYEERVHALEMVAEELKNEGYHDIDKIQQRLENVLILWKTLLDILKQRRARLDLSLKLQKLFQEMSYLYDWMEDIKVRLQTEDCGKHLMGVEDLMQKHELLETDIRVLGNRIEKIIADSQYFITCDSFPADVDAGYVPWNPENVKERGQDLRKEYLNLRNVAGKRLNNLEESREMWRFFWNMADEEQWIREMEQLMMSPDLGHDISSVDRLYRKHIGLEQEIKVKNASLQSNLEKGENLINKGNIGASNLRKRIQEMRVLWEKLIDITAKRHCKLRESQQFHQFMADCDDAEVWMNDTKRQASSEEVGNKLAVTESLIKKHDEIRVNVEEYNGSVEELHEVGHRLGDYESCDEAKIEERLAQISKFYLDLVKVCKQRNDHLQDALAMYKVFSVSDTVQTWITEKEKLLTTLAPTDEVDELAVLRQRFEFLETEMARNADKVKNVVDLSTGLKEHDHPDSKNIEEKMENLNATWATLADVVDGKRKDLRTAILYNDFFVNCEETDNWIKDKANLIESTDELENDLDGIMQLQRRLGGLQRDLTVIQAKIDDLDEKAEDLMENRPADAENILKQRDSIHASWKELKDMLKERDERLNSSSELQRFLQDLDHFQMWLSRAQSQAVCEDIPKDLDEAEKLQLQHNQLCDEIDSYEPEFQRLMDFGRKITDGQTDAQYMFLSQRLNGLDEGWATLQDMKEARRQFLHECLQAQIFFRDALQVDVSLSKQEVYLAKEDIPSNLETAQEALINHENFIATCGANNEKVDRVLKTGQDLVDKNIFSADRIQAKCDQIRERRDSLHDKAAARKEQLEEALLMQEFAQDVDDVEEWIAEKFLVASDDSYRDAKDLTSRYNRFKAFEDELGANKDKIEKVMEHGETLKEQHPEYATLVDPRLESLRNQWDELMATTQEKSAKIADSNREKLFSETAQNVSAWLTEMNQQIITEDTETEEIISLVELNKKQGDINNRDKDFQAKKRQMNDLEMHAEKLKQQYPERQAEFEQVQQEVRTRLIELEAPLLRRVDNIDKRRRVGQLLRDLQDEKDWCREKIDQLSNNDVGSCLLEVQQLLRRLRFLKTEVDNHKPARDHVYAEVERMSIEQHPKAEQFLESCAELKMLWDKLEGALEVRFGALDTNERVQQYLFDAAEMEAWMGEQELYLMGEDKTKDEQGANNAIKKHEQLHSTLEYYGEEIKRLGARAQEILDEAEENGALTPDQKQQTAQRQARIDKMYAGLNDLSNERRNRLGEILKKFHLLREIVDLETWIGERIHVASSHELGSDFEHCCLLRERFSEFVKDTKDVGKVRVGAANELCDALINQGHSDAAEIAQWKDRINEAWADLLELMETRTQLLKAAWDLHKFLCDCQDVLERIEEKAAGIPEGSGKDAKCVASLQRKLDTFEHELHGLGQKVEGVVESANHLLPSYAGGKERSIHDSRDEVIAAWRALQQNTERRKLSLVDAADFHRFMAMVRELQQWMEVMRGQMDVREKPRDVSGVDLMMNSHRSLRAELDAREENFSICLSLGRTLLNRGHERHVDVRGKCVELVTERQRLLDEWSDRWEHLSLMYEVYQFTRDAALAEAWLISQESYLTNINLGENLDDTLALIKKHLAFEKCLSTQDDRFAALKKLTTFELKERERTPETEEARRRERERRIQEDIREFQPAATPPQSTTQPHKKSSVAAFDQQQQSTGGSEGGRPESAVPPSMGTDIGRKDSTRSQMQDLEGTLARKHEWQGDGKKASTRSWHELFFVLNVTEGILSVYKDAKHGAKERRGPGDFYHNEGPMSLAGAVASTAPNYTKRPNVFRLKLVREGIFLFQAKTNSEMVTWVRTLNAVAKGSRRGSPELGGGPPPTSSATLPPSGGVRTTTTPSATSATMGKPEKKKKSLFGKK